MHTAAAAAATQTPPGKSLPASSSPKTGDASQNAGGSSAAPGGKVKKRERTETSTEASKRERSGNGEDGDVKSDHEPDKECSSNTAGGGVTGVASVEKLVTAMQQDRIDGSRKAADCASRRTVLAAAIAGTENHECLERFVQLGGVALFHEWLQEAYKGKCGEGESPKEGVSKAVEELLLTVLSALEKLPVDLQALRCQVGKSVNNLKSHKNVEIKEKARKLVETWKKRVGDEINLPTGSKSGTGHTSQWSTNIKNLPVSMSASDMTGQQTGVQASNGSALSIYKSTEKGSTNQAQNNGQVWSGNAAPSALAWKEDVKNSTPPSSGSKTSHRSSNLHAKGSSGLNPAANKESATPKAAAWSRDKGDLPAPESGTKVVLRLPRSVSAGLNEEVFGPGSQGSSPSLPDQTTASSIADASEPKPRLQVSAAKYALPSEPVAEQNHDENTVAKTELKELERKHSGADVSRTSADTNDRAISMAIVPVSAVSRISGSERDMGVGISARSTVVSTVDREVVEPGVAEAGAAKEEARRKDIQDAADGANCASSSSFTEMSVAGQGAAVEHKSELSSAAQDGDENSRSRLELEGLGESPEPRPSSRRFAGGDQFPGGDALQPEKRIAARCSYEGLGRRLERYDNSWEDKRSSYFPGKDGRKSSSEAESRKIGPEPETARVKSPDFSGKVQDIKRMDSASEFVEDDALEVAQQIAKEVEQEMETSHLSSTKDEREHLTTKEPVSSPGPILENSCVSAEKLDVGVRVESTDNATNDDPECSTPPVQPGEPAEQEENQEPASEAAIAAPAMDAEKAQPASSSNAEEEKPAEVIPQPRPDFDLNEGLGGDEGVKDVSCTPVLSLAASSAAGPTTPIPVLLKGAFIPPDSLMKAKSEPGWRGSAATSAFRPAEPRRVQETQQQSASETKEPSSSGKQPRLPLDIDLNVAETDTGFESQAISSFISKPFSEKQQQQPASTSGRVDFDLNCTDGCDDGVGLEIQVETSGLGRKTTTTRDFDLNGPVEEEPGVQHINLRSGTENTSMVPPSVTGFRLGGGAGDLPGVAAAPWFPSGNTFPAVAMPAFPMARAETSYPVQAQPFLNAGTGAIHFNVDLYRGGMTLATPTVAYPTNPPVPYPYAAGFPFASNYSFNTSAPFPASFVEAPAGSGSYPAAVSSQIGGPGSMTRFIRPHLMGIGDAAAAAAAAPGRNDGAAWTVRPSLDLNTGPEAPEDLRPQAAGRTVALEDHLRGFGQVAAPTGKRKEPENGWEAFQAGYKQPAWC